MRTLKEIRTERGLSQADVANVIRTSISNYCNFESGQSLPILEDMIGLEHNFTQRIKWNETIDQYEKQEIIRELMVLMENYPLSSVITFATKALKEGQRLGNPGLLINHYAGVAQRLDIEPLINYM